MTFLPISPENYKRFGLVGFIICILLWLFIVLLGFSYFARCAFTSGEKFRLSLGFSILSIFCPPFACIPIALNVNK